MYKILVWNFIFILFYNIKIIFILYKVFLYIFFSLRIVIQIYFPFENRNIKTSLQGCALIQENWGIFVNKLNSFKISDFKFKLLKLKKL